MSREESEETAPLLKHVKSSVEHRERIAWTQSGDRMFHEIGNLVAHAESQGGGREDKQGFLPAEHLEQEYRAEDISWNPELDVRHDGPENVTPGGAPAVDGQSQLLVGLVLGSYD